MIDLEPKIWKTKIMSDKKSERITMRFCVCYQCGKGPHSKDTLFKVGESQDGQTVFGCAEHRGLRGMVNP